MKKNNIKIIDKILNKIEDTYDLDYGETLIDSRDFYQLILEFKEIEENEN